MEPSFEPIDLGVGYLLNRTSIWLGAFHFQADGKGFRIEGELNPTIDEEGLAPSRSVGFMIVFQGMIAIRAIELDTWESVFTSSPTDGPASAFAIVLNSDWLAGMGGKAGPQHRHYIVTTYDYVVEVICESFDLVIGSDVDDKT